MKWLSKKTERVAQVLKEKNIHIGGGAVSSNFVKSAKDDPVTIGKKKVNYYKFHGTQSTSDLLHSFAF